MNKKAKISFGILIILLVIGIFLINLNKVNSETFYFPEWTNFKEIKIENLNHSIIYNYTIRMNISKENNMDSTYKDLRFVNSSLSGNLSYWLEKDSNGTTSVIVWVRVDKLLNQTNTSIYMLYGNSGAEPNSDPIKTFWYFKNFSNSNDYTTTTSGSGYVNIYSYNDDSRVEINSFGTSNLGYLTFSSSLNKLIPFEVGFKMINITINSPVKYGGTESFYIPFYNDGSGFQTDGSCVTYGGCLRISEFNVWKTNDANTTQLCTNGGNSLYNSWCVSSDVGAGFDRFESVSLGDKSPDNYHGGRMNIDYFYVTHTYSTPEPTYSIGEEMLYSFPGLSISYPMNNTNFTYNLISINYTITGNFQSCWWTNNSGFYNISLICGNNISRNWFQGWNNITIFANNTIGNQNSSSISFYISVYPSLTISEPQNKNYANNNTIFLNYTVDDILGVSSCWYKVINSSGYLNIDNTTITNCLNTTFGLISGDIDYNLTLYINDSLNNINSSTVNFGIRTSSPSVNLNYPTNNQWLNYKNNVPFNFTAIKNIGLSTCDLWSNFTGTWKKNYTWVNPTNNTMNWTYVNLTDGSYLWNVFCNDTLNNNGWALNNFTMAIDTIYPNVSISNPVNNTIFSTNGDFYNLSIDYNITDINIDTCHYNITYSGGTEVSTINLGCNEIFTSKQVRTSVSGINYTLTLCGQDKANNLKCNYRNFVAQFQTQAGTTISGGGGGGVTIIIGNLSWAILTSDNSNSYIIESSKGSSRTLGIKLKNLGIDPVNLTLSCENELCEYITFKETKINLNAGDSFETSFDLVLPEDIEEKEYNSIIVATDNLGNRAGLNLKANVGGRLSVLSEIVNKLGSSASIFGINIPYFLLSLIFSVLMIYASYYLILFKFKEVRLAFSIIIGILIFFITPLFF